MEPEKLAITGVLLVVVVLGLTLGVSVLAFQLSDDGGTDTTLTGITPDRDLLELGLTVPSNWEFELSDGTILSLSDLEGKIVLVDLMATWCTYCETQNDYLETVYETLSGSLEILSFTIDKSETAAMMEDYKTDRGLPWEHGLDTNAAFTTYFQVTSVPTLVLIDSDGYFRYLHIGVWSEAVLTDRIASII